MKITYNKLIRDNIPDIMNKANKNYKTRIYDNDEYILALKNKVVEEANEVKESMNKEELINEIADLYEVIEALMVQENITVEQINSAKVLKTQKNGAFQKQLCLEYVIEDDK